MDPWAKIAELEQRIADLEHRQMNIASRGTLLENADEKKIQQAKVKGLYGEELKNIQRWEQFGFTSHMPPGGDVLLMSINGNRDEAQIVAHKHPDYRPVNSEEGSTTIYDINGNTIVLSSDGIKITSPKQIILEAPDIALDGMVYLGGPVGSGVPTSQLGTVDTCGCADVGGLATRVNTV